MFFFRNYKYIFRLACLISGVILSMNNASAQSSYGSNDTLLRAAIIFEGDTIEAKTLSEILVYSYLGRSFSKAKWTRLRNAVYVTYP